MDKKIIEIFNRWADQYDNDIELAEKENDWLYQNYSKILKIIILKIKKYCSPKDKKIIIDIGAGTGNLLMMASKEGYSIIGVEPSAKMCSKIKNKGICCQIIRGDFLCLPFKFSTVDVIVSSYAWHHLSHQDKLKSIDVMQQILRTNGVIIIADLMFASQRSRQELISKLKQEKKMDLIADIESEHYGDIQMLEVEFRKRGFDFYSHRLTKLVWLIEAQLLTR
jgi:ubiquinone/menaquinone biosynthesis C-methylase UbiE